VLGASACVLSSPYGVPEWMPDMLQTLARWAGEPSPVKETVQRTFSEFKKTHQDTWQQTKAAFTSEQWDNISVGMELAPSYIS
jgi:proteasome activator subunit 4